MKPEDYDKLITALNEERLSLSKKKRHDYAKTDDCLVNFKDLAMVSKILKIDITTPFGCAVFLEVLKVARKCNVIFGEKKPLNEGVKDTIMDQHNYIDLGYALLVEENEN